MAGKRLIVNADDYNTDTERNRGIVQSVREGIVTSVSVIANLPLIDTSVLELHEVFGSHVGVHLNLTRGAPLVPGLKTLTGTDGQFLPKRGAWKRALLRGYDLEELKQEFSAQMSVLKGAGLSIDHLDGNNHIHVFPGIAEVVASLANDFQVSAIRLPREPFNTWGQYCSAGAGKKALIGWLSKQAISVFRRWGLWFPDHCAGIQFPRVGDAASLRAFIDKLPGGTTELICHPGYRNEQVNPYSTTEREKEVCALTHGRVREDINQFGITLVSFKDLE